MELNGELIDHGVLTAIARASQFQDIIIALLLEGSRLNIFIAHCSRLKVQGMWFCKSANSSCTCLYLQETGNFDI
jgi:hypothetical protein